MDHFVTCCKQVHIKLTGEYELHILSNTKVSAAKDYGENYMEVRPPQVCHL